MERFPEANKPGYAVYSKASLAIYDALVLGLSNRFIWRCPSEFLTALYNRNLSEDHLDIGVGTGYFLDKARFPVSAPKVTLMDPNELCLQKAASRIARYDPISVQADALILWPEALGSFRSIGLNYLLHCLPGTMSEKSVLFDHLKPHLAESGTLFGATILQGNAPRSALARKLMRIYNGKGVFSNENDTQEGLETELSRRFRNVDIEMMGCVALFSASEPV
ncbi:class I SAM-dependent methyltransferase [Roseibium sp. SCP14]|uniref:class I SAM-dependent methyltransferase n=1 Tax=Roseibium sp. SCP14 TaxID=3141375 RepID=UPI00333BBD82